MPVLANSKHERFAQGVARGLTQTEAYVEAGYRDTGAARANGARLMTKDSIAARVSQIKEAAANRAEISLARITSDLLRVAQKAEDLQDASGLSVARGSYTDIAKMHGLSPDKVEHSGPGGAAIAHEIKVRFV